MMSSFRSYKLFVCNWVLLYNHCNNVLYHRMVLSCYHLLITHVYTIRVFSICINWLAIADYVAVQANYMWITLTKWLYTVHMLFPTSLNTIKRQFTGIQSHKKYVFISPKLSRTFSRHLLLLLLWLTETHNTVCINR